jgi:DNA polymerase (family 10)
MEHLIKAARATGTALEINAQPQRMDLDDRYARMASERGVKLVISTDSHSYDQFDFMQLGVAIARRAWCKKKDILNTRSWADLMKFYRKKQSSKPAMSTV